MRLFVLFIPLLCSLSIFGQQFRPDASGHVSDPAFLKLIKSRNYSLVGAFDSLPVSKPAMAAQVLKDKKWMYIDWNGKEYANYDALGEAFGFEAGPVEVMEVVDPGERMPEMYEELQPLPGPNGYTGVFRENYRAGFKYNDKIILPAVYDAVEQLYHYRFLFLKVRQEGLYAIFDYRGKAITPFIYEDISILEVVSPQCAFIVKSEGHYGVLSQKAGVTIPPVFDKITEYDSGNNHLLLVQKDTLFGAYNFAGKQIAEPVYEHLEPFWSESPKLALSARRNGKYGILGMSGAATIPLTYRYRLYYGAKQAFITYSDDNHFRKIGALDTTGKPLLPAVFGLIYQPEGGNCLFVMVHSGNRKFGVYDLSGNKVLDTIYSSYEPFGAISENDHSEPAKCYQFSLSDGKRLKYGLFNVRNLQWIVPCEYDRYNISKNYLLIGKGNDENRVMGLVDREGKFAVPLQYPDLDYREDDRIAVVQQNGNYGVIDFKGTVLLPFRYKRLTLLPEYTTGRNAFPLPKGHFIFSQDSLCGLMKLNQKVIIPAKYIAIVPTRSGFICRSGDSCTVVNYSGKTILSSAPLGIAEIISGIFSYNETPDSRIVLDLYGQDERITESVVSVEPVVVQQIPDPARVYDSGELTSPASFPGGEQAMKKFLSENLKYPQEAMDLGLEGKCFLEFEVNTNGKLSGVKVLRGVRDCPECDREAMRVVKTMPDWIPGQLNGVAVICRMRIPVQFRLQ